MSLQSSLCCRSNLLLLSLLLIFACRDNEAPEVTEVTSLPDYRGIYRVRGTTVEIENGATREIEGLVVLKQQDDGYVTSFDLRTGIPVEGQTSLISVEVIGNGTGEVSPDSLLRGEAHTQLVRAVIPGVDARFPFLPRAVGARIVSTTVARIRPDGSLEIDIESRPDEGEVYAATRTALIGQRVPDVPGGGSTPSVSSGPED